MQVYFPRIKRILRRVYKKPARELLNKIKNAKSSLEETEEWRILIDGSAYLGQLEYELEIRSGTGLMVDTMGNYMLGHFKNDKF